VQPTPATTSVGPMGDWGRPSNVAGSPRA